MGTPNAGGVGRNRRLWTNNRLYLENGKRLTQYCQGHVSNIYIVDLDNFAKASRRYTGDIHNSSVIGLFMTLIRHLAWSKSELRGRPKADRPPTPVRGIAGPPLSPSDDRSTSRSCAKRRETAGSFKSRRRTGWHFGPFHAV